MHIHTKWIGGSLRKRHKVSYSILKSLRTLYTKVLVMAIAMKNTFCDVHTKRQESHGSDLFQNPKYHLNSCTIDFKPVDG